MLGSETYPKTSSIGRSISDDAALGKPIAGVGIVRDQIHGRVGCGVGADPFVGEPFRLVVGADAVDLPAEHQVLRVGAVAGEEDGLIAFVDEHADLAGGVPGNGHERDVARVG